MKILIDTNIMLDILLDREGFSCYSKKAIEKAIMRGDKLYFSSASLTDLYYLINKQTKNSKLALNAIREMSTFLNFCDVNEEIVLSATLSKINDYEDAVLDMIVANNKIDYIMTRNIVDFKNSINKIITPKDFLDSNDFLLN